jgi:hypothetical protein
LFFPPIFNRTACVAPPTRLTCCSSRRAYAPLFSVFPSCVDARLNNNVRSFLRKRSQVTTSACRPARLTLSDSPISVAARRTFAACVLHRRARPLGAFDAACAAQHARAPLARLALARAVHTHATASARNPRWPFMILSAVPPPHHPKGMMACHHSV